MKNIVSRISAQNFAGGSFAYELAPFTAIIGKNMEGKSSVANAIRIGLIGYSPLKGNKPGLTWGYSSHPTEMKISLCLSDPAASREVRREPIINRPFEQTVNRSWNLCAGKIVYTGNGPLCPPVLLDIQNEYLGLSGPDKVALVFKKLNLTEIGLDANEITARLKREIKIETPSAESETAIAAACEIVQQKDVERKRNGYNVQYSIDLIADAFDAWRKRAKATIDGMAGLQRGTAELSLENQTPKQFTPAQGKKLFDLRQEQSELNHVARRNRERAGQRAQLAEELESNSDELKMYEDVASDIEAAKKTIRAQEAEWKPVDTTKTAKLKKELEGATINHATIGAAVEKWQEKIDELAANLKEHVKGDCCPVCKSKGKAWKESLRKFVTAEIESAKKSLAKQRKELKSAETEMEDARANLTAAEEIAAAVEVLKGEIEESKQKLKDLEAHQETRKRLLAQQETLLKRKSEIEPDEILGDAARWELEKRIQELIELEREAIEENARATQSEEARQKANMAKAEMEVAKQALDVIKAVRLELMQKGFASFIGKVNVFTQGIIKQPIVYDRDTIGKWNGSTFVSIEHFSGTEKMLTGIGLAVALAQESPVRIVFCDEWHSDAENRLKVICRLNDLINEGVIDQAIVIDTKEDGFKEIGAGVIRITR